MVLLYVLGTTHSMVVQRFFCGSGIPELQKCNPDYTVVVRLAWDCSQSEYHPLFGNNEQRNIIHNRMMLCLEDIHIYT